MVADERSQKGLPPKQMVEDNSYICQYKLGFTQRKLNLNLQQHPFQLWLSPPIVFQV